MVEDWMKKCNRDFGSLLVKTFYNPIIKKNSKQSHGHRYSGPLGILPCESIVRDKIVYKNYIENEDPVY